MTRNMLFRSRDYRFIRMLSCVLLFSWAVISRAEETTPGGNRSPFPSETVDIYRHPYPGALFNQFPVSGYATGTVEYRREFLPFLYLHLRQTFVWANRISFTSQTQKFSDVSGEALSVGLTSGFFGNSQL